MYLKFTDLKISVLFFNAAHNTSAYILFFEMMKIVKGVHMIVFAWPTDCTEMYCFMSHVEVHTVLFSFCNLGCILVIMGARVAQLV